MEDSFKDYIHISRRFHNHIDNQRIKNEFLWKEAYCESSVVKYEQLMDDFGRTPQFLYNYAVKQQQLGDTDKALELAIKCREILSHYDLEILLGDLYYKKKDFERAEMHYHLASRMCPSRFIPLNALYHVYSEKGDKDKAYEIAQTIINKPMKVETRDTKLIKYKMKTILKSDSISTYN